MSAAAREIPPRYCWALRCSCALPPRASRCGRAPGRFQKIVRRQGKAGGRRSRQQLTTRARRTSMEAAPAALTCAAMSPAAARRSSSLPPLVRRSSRSCTALLSSVLPAVRRARQLLATRSHSSNVATAAADSQPRGAMRARGAAARGHADTSAGRCAAAAPSYPAQRGAGALGRAIRAASGVLTSLIRRLTSPGRVLTTNEGRRNTPGSRPNCINRQHVAASAHSTTRGGGGPGSAGTRLACRP